MNPNPNDQGRSQADNIASAMATNTALWIAIGLLIVYCITCTHQPVSEVGVKTERSVANGR